MGISDEERFQRICSHHVVLQHCFLLRVRYENFWTHGKVASGTDFSEFVNSVEKEKEAVTRDANIDSYKTYTGSSFRFQSH